MTNQKRSHTCVREQHNLIPRILLRYVEIPEHLHMSIELIELFLQGRYETAVQPDPWLADCAVCHLILCIVNVHLQEVRLVTRSWFSQAYVMMYIALNPKS